MPIRGRLTGHWLPRHPSRGPAGVPMSDNELWTKFSDCAALSLPAAQIRPLFERLAAIETVASVHDLTRLLEVAQEKSRAA